MPRQRMVKPEFFTHYELFEAEQRSGLPVRLAFEGLWCVADREGRFEWKPPVLKLDILPYDTVDFSKVLHVLERAGFIHSYSVEGRKFGVIPTFSRHQSPHVRENQSVIPAPPAPNGGSPARNGVHADDVPGESTGPAPGQHRAEHQPSPAEYGIRNTESESVEEHADFAADAAPSPCVSGESVDVVLRREAEPKGARVNGHRAVRDVLTTVATKSRLRGEADEERAGQTEFVFAYWALVMQHPRALFDDQRRQRIAKRLVENGGDVGELLYAIDGARKTPYLMGQNESGTRYDGVETVLRDRAQVEKLAGMCAGYKRGDLHPRIAELNQAVSNVPEEQLT